MNDHLNATGSPSEEIVRRAKERGLYGALMAWDNFHKIVFYGTARWPSYSYWIVPGTITDETRM